MPTTALKAARAASAAPTGEDRSSPGSHDERHDREGAPLVPWDFICRKKDRIRQRAGEAVERGGPASPVFEVEFPNAGMAPVTVGAFETLEIPLLKGRYFDRSDTPESSPVAIVNNSLARATWPNEDPIGKQIRLGYPSNPYGPWRTIVGIVGDVKQHGVDQETPRQLYMPITQQPRTEAFAVARTRFAVPDSTLKAAIDALDRSIPAYNDRTVDQVMH